METLKGGCILINKANKCIGLIYRGELNDFTYPKGHLEPGEDLMTCAIRETAEETKRVAVVVDEEPIIERYTTPKGEQCCTYMYLAVDNGHSDNDSLEVHDLLWVPIDEVEDKLSYTNLKETWRAVKSKVLDIINK